MRGDPRAELASGRRTMRHLYSPTPGEFLVGAELERREFRVYLPTKDSGIDLLAARDEHHLAVQVKESRTYPQPARSAVDWTSWTQLGPGDLGRAQELGVDFFVFVVHVPDVSGARPRFLPLYIVIAPGELERRLAAYRPSADRAVYWYQSEDRQLWEVRGRRSEAGPPFRVAERNFTSHLNAWGLLEQASESPL